MKKEKMKKNKNFKFFFSYSILGDFMFEIYKVKDNENLDIIADNYNTSPEYILKINGLDRNISSGENIIVPKVINYYTDYYSIKEGINLTEFAKENNIDDRLLSNLNGLNKEDYLYPNQTILIPKNNMNYYITTDTDTLNDISKIMNVNIIDLINQNNNIFLKKGQLIIYKEK